MLFIAFLLLWIVFNGKTSTEVLIIGAAISAALALFTKQFLLSKPKHKKITVSIRKTLQLIKYFGTLLKEIVLANKQVMTFILSQKYEIQPKLAFVKTKLKEDASRAILADSITLTPGTITVSLEKDNLVVHCLDEDLEKDLTDSVFEKRLLAIENIGREDGKNA